MMRLSYHWPDTITASISPPQRISRRSPCSCGDALHCRQPGTHAGHQLELAAIFELDLELAFETIEHMTLVAPVAREISGPVLYDAHADIAALASAPIGHTGCARVLGALDCVPVRRREGEAR